MTMGTLRRWDSLPSRLREAPVALDFESDQPITKVPNSKTDSNFCDTLKLDEVVAKWKLLNTDVEKIPNSFVKNGPLTAENRKTVTHNFVSEYKFNKTDKKRKLVFNNVSTAICSKEDNSNNSLPVDVAQTYSVECGASKARRRTLLERLLSWRTPECNCREKFTPKMQPTPRLRAEDLLCTCGVSRGIITQQKQAERGRSKSVGYEAAREVTQFRRCASAGATVGVDTATALRARAALTLARRYYPEGGWGWTITVVGTIVQIISHGLQLGGGTGAVACTAAVKYRVPPVYSYGKFLYFL